MLESLDLPHVGGVNRVRSCPSHPHIIASFADTAQVHIWDASKHLNALSGGGPRPPTTGPAARPVFSFDGHTEEGFAMDWQYLAGAGAGAGANGAAGAKLATGDCSGGIRVWEGADSGAGLVWSVDPKERRAHTASVEDLQWSPSEPTVFMSCSADQSLMVWDVRQPDRGMLQVRAHDSDVNVISWNRNVSYLVASGADNGDFKVTSDGPHRHRATAGPSPRRRRTAAAATAAAARLAHDRIAYHTRSGTSAASDPTRSPRRSPTSVGTRRRSLPSSGTQRTSRFSPCRATTTS